MIAISEAMDARQVRRFLPLFLLAFFVAVVAGAIGIVRPADWISVLKGPSPGGLPVLSRPADCTHDPANLPAPPPGPEGRSSNYYHTCGNRIYDSHRREVRITGVSWAGMETSDDAPGGLGNRNWQEILDQVAAMGYNTIRVPFSTEAIQPGQHVGNVNFTLNPDLQGLTGLEMLDRIVEGARARGLKVLLDRHQPTSAGRTNLWYTVDVPDDKWIADWRMLAARYRGNDTVIGVDLHNEPHGEATWGDGNQATDWRLAAERAGNAVLDVNPYLLVFVEGIETYDGDHFWWGGNLEGVRDAPVRLRVPNRVVYSPHDYGPYVSDQTWFHDPNFPRNLPSEWDRHWGYIAEEGIAPVVVGEFGGWSFGTDADGQWHLSLLDYLRVHQFGFFVWALNPGWDTGGIFQDNWQRVNQIKQSHYQALLAPPLDTGPGGVFGRAPTRLEVLFRQGSGGDQSRQVSFAFHIFNDGPTKVDLSRLELRYWFSAGPLDPQTRQVSIESGDLPGAIVQADVVPTTKGQGGYYLRIRFAPGSGTIDRYRETGTVTVRFEKPASAVAPTNDYSFAGAPLPGNQFQQWNRVTLYRDGRLVWGQEP